MATNGSRLLVLSLGLQRLETRTRRNGGDTDTRSATELECLPEHVHVVGKVAVCLLLTRIFADARRYPMAQNTNEHEWLLLRNPFDE